MDDWIYSPVANCWMTGWLGYNQEESGDGKAFRYPRFKGRTPTINWNDIMTGEDESHRVQITANKRNGRNHSHSTRHTPK